MPHHLNQQAYLYRRRRRCCRRYTLEKGTQRMTNNSMSRVMRLGRAKVFAVGLAVVLTVVLGVATTAPTAVPGDPFRLGRVNYIDRLSTLVGTTANAMLRVDNNGTGPALSLEVGAGNPPVVVNAAAGKATNLDADELDGQNSSAFLPAEIYEKSASQEIFPGSSSGTTATCDPGDLAVSGSYTISQSGARPVVTSGAWMTASTRRRATPTLRAGT